MSRVISTKNSLTKSVLALVITLSVLILPGVSSLHAQDSTPEASVSPTPEAVVTPIPLSNIVTEAATTTRRLQKIRESLDVSSGVSLIESRLPLLKKDLDSRLPETQQILAGRPSLEVLNKSEQDWIGLQKQIPAWKADLKAQIGIYDNYIKEFESLTDKWQKTLEALNVTVPPDSSEVGEPSPTPTTEKTAKSEIPSVVLAQIQTELDLIAKTQKQVEEQRSQILTLQSRVSSEEVRIADTLASIKEVRSVVLSFLFVRDSPPIWSAYGTSESATSLSTSINQQVAGLSGYVDRHRDSFYLHGGIILLLIALFYWLRGRMKPWLEKEPKLKRAFTVFELPIASALVLSVLMSGWLYPQAPRTLTAILAALALIPGIFFLRRVLERPLYPILNALVFFFFVDRLREICSSLPFVSRLLFLIEVVTVGVFLVWFIRAHSRSEELEHGHEKIFHFVRKVAPFVLVLFAVAFIANVFGFVSLANLIGRGSLGSAYAALILYAAVQVIESLLIFAFRVKPLRSLRMVEQHRSLLQNQAFRAIQWVAIFFWFSTTLNLFSIRTKLYDFVMSYINAKLVLGSMSISLGDILLFVFTVWLAFFISKIVRFVLEEDVYPRVKLAGGVPYAISTILHYSLLVIGFFVALASFGLDLTKFTILAGAFGVGLGFGLQNIVNNFVSGLILLFERPVKVNDFVQIGENQGDLKRIGLRASVVRTLEGSEVIVPNGNLISEEVTNWTFSDRQRRLEINIGVAYGSDPRQVMDLLIKIADEHSNVLKDPPPRAIFMAFGDSSLDFQLRAWTDDADQWMVVRSDLTLGVHDALYEAEIEIPFPQRDLHIRSGQEKLGS